MPTKSRLVRLAALALALAIAGPGAPVPSPAQDGAPSPGRQSLDRFVGIWQVVVREPGPDGAWRTAAPTIVRASTLLRDKFVVLDGFFALPGHERPLGMVLVLSHDPFQDLVRIAALDDFVGLLDGYSGGWQEGRLVVTNLRCDTPFEGHHGRFTILPGDADRFEMHVEVSADRGATWRTTQVASFVRQ